MTEDPTAKTKQPKAVVAVHEDSGRGNTIAVQWPASAKIIARDSRIANNTATAVVHVAEPNIFYITFRSLKSFVASAKTSSKSPHSQPLSRGIKYSVFDKELHSSVIVELETSYNALFSPFAKPRKAASELPQKGPSRSVWYLTKGSDYLVEVHLFDSQGSPMYVPENLKLSFNCFGVKSEECQLRSLWQSNEKVRNYPFWLSGYNSNTNVSCCVYPGVTFI